MSDYPESPFKDVLHTNHIPSASEIVQINEHIRAPKQRLTEVDAERTHLLTVLRTLSKEKTALERYILPHAVLISPIRLVPDDVLREIFLHCLAHPYASTMDAHRPPLLLGRVCSRWRTLLYATSAMWANFNIAIGSRGPNFNGRDGLGIQQWLSRPREVVLSISVRKRALDMSRWAQDTLKAYLDKIFQFSEKIREMSVQLYPVSTYGKADVAQATLLELCSSDLPLLRKLTVRFGPHTYTASERWAGTALFAAPQLHSLTLINMGHPIVETMPAESWARITYLDIALHHVDWTRGISATEAHELLSQCRSLKVVYMTIVDEDEGIDAEGEVEQPFLETLSISEDSGSIYGLLERLVVPALRHLRYVGRLWVEYPSPMLVLLENYGESVEQLEIDVYTLTLDDLVGCLRLLPNATRITQLARFSSWPIEFLNPLRTFLDLLILQADAEQHLCPKLSNLTFEQGVFGTVDVRQVLEFLESRMKTSISNLREVAFGNVSGIDLAEVPQIRELFQPFLSRGLRVFVNCEATLRRSSSIHETISYFM
ncbi:unnamed protein product [Cyclocybe aegerita]|uniref:F-box domain-containing protein n=1 Tax=Cyclocybe aegerita TaxID=1973307 RepID=A0A8S0XQM5_CYCAE|nr:unnamed protein product [Cyclocybe aegerita]